MREDKMHIIFQWENHLEDLSVNNIKMDLKDIGLDVDWIHLAQNRD
jgi:hypothetical protein